MSCVSDFMSNYKGFNLDTSDRLKIIRGTMTQNEFADSIGVHKNSLGRYERGDSEPDLRVAITICTKFGISPEWLMFGTGPMCPSDAASNPQQTIEQPSVPTKAAGPCPRCERMEVKLEKVELQRDELAQENRQLWKENGELRERCATLEERQKQCCPAEYHPKKANIPSSDPLHIR